MHVQDTGIQGLYLIEPQVWSDNRGYFFEAFHEGKLVAHGITERFVQTNHSFSKRGVLRGLHFQRPPFAQSKLVRVLSGKVYDVVVDLRQGSATFGKWFGAELSAENRLMMYVPVGFAHGFYAMTDAEFLYQVGHSMYDKASEGGLRYNDPGLNIVWPLAGEPVVNERDAVFPTLGELGAIFSV